MQVLYIPYSAVYTNYKHNQENPVFVGFREVLIKLKIDRIEELDGLTNLTEWMMQSL